MAEVSLRDLRKSYGTTEVIHGITCGIADGELVVVVGPSGCGKSTLLRMVAGLEEVTAGEIAIAGKVVNAVEPKDRDIAMVFQNYALYPHMTVRENMGFALKLAKVPQNEIDSKVAEAAKILDLEQHLDRKPANLSGGQRQRVAMGRAIVRSPSAFLMDEPLSNLDAKLRVQMRTEIKKVHQKVNTTTVYVTHDQVEAMTLADRVVVMNAGRIEQVGPPNELYHSPRTKFVAGFIGSPAMNFIPCRLEESGGGGLTVRVGDGLVLPVPSGRTASYRAHLGKELILGLRPEHITEAHPHAEPGTAEFAVPVDVVEPMGMETMLYFAMSGTQICARVSPETPASPGATVNLLADLRHMHLIDPTTNQVIEVPVASRGNAQPSADATALRRGVG
ncbi:MAG TPA: sn-glycerol-3-phosphate ABC transporter ATP-binding protein UgpC [Stellaceae bacterium]|nr:sn-glycerol-3-phosphate ABC transporter ATP-binding protein UgpC [Stellaceae bacterium]